MAFVPYVLPNGQPSPTDIQRMRRDGQWSELFLAIHQPAVVFTARLTSAPSSTDRVAQIAYNSGVGSGALAGMTVCVGSTSGAWDKGQVRLRNTPALGATGTLDINETSEIAWVNGDYLSVLDEFGLWARQVRLTTPGSSPLMDYDIAYSDQHAVMAPIPCLGPHAVAWLTGASVAVSFDASTSWYPTVSAGPTNGCLRYQALYPADFTFAWTAPGGSIDSATSVTPTITYTSPGTYRVTCAVTVAGRTTTAYRYVFVFRESDALPITQFALNGAVSSSDEGYPFSVKLWADAALSTVRDRALVILFARDHYGDEVVSIGAVPGRTNLIAWGWLAGESIEWNPEQSAVAFEVKPVGYWLGQLPAYPTGQLSTLNAATAWTEFQSLVVDKALWHLLMWRSTLPLVTDCFVTSDQTGVAELSAPAATLWEQLTTMGYQSVLAKPKVDRYGRLIVHPDCVYWPLENRSSSIIRMLEPLTTDDWHDAIAWTRQATAQGALLDLSGVFFDGATPTAFFSLAYGRVLGRHGRVERVERLALPDQARANELSGLYLGQINNEWPTLSIKLAGNNRFFDIAPAMCAFVSLAAGDTPRGVAVTNLQIIPRRVSYQWNDSSGLLSADVEFEALAPPEVSVTGDGPGSEPPQPPDPPPTPDPPPGGGSYSGKAVAATSGKIAYTTSFLNTTPTWTDKTGSLTGTLVDIAVDPYDQDNTVYALTTATLYKTTNFQNTPPTWTSVKTAAQVQTDYSLTSVVFERLSLSTNQQGVVSIFFRFGSGGVSGERLYSSNGGSSWTISSQASYNVCTSDVMRGFALSQNVIPARGATLFLFSTDCVSQDIYTNVANPSATTPVFDLAIAKPIDLYWPRNGNSSDLYFYLLSTTTLWLIEPDTDVKTDTGFTEATTVTVPHTRIACGDTVGDVMALTDAKLKRQTTAGGGWTTLKSGLGTCGGLVRLATDSGQVFFWETGTTKALWYSTDYGANWVNRIGNWVSAIDAFTVPLLVIPIWI